MVERVENEDGFCIEHARSGRSKCRGCQLLIGHGDARFGAPETEDGRGTRWFHVSCGARRFPVEVEELLADWPDIVPEKSLVDELLTEQPDQPIDHLLSGALDLARQGAWDDLLGDLLVVWRGVSSPILADRIDEVSRLVRLRQPRLPTKRREVTAVVEPLDLYDPVELERLIEAVPYLAKDRAQEIVRAGTRGRRDPRWGRAVVDWLYDPPFQSGETFWKVVLSVLRLQADHRALERLDGYRPESWFQDWSTRWEVEWRLEQHLPNLMMELGAVPELSENAHRLQGEIAALVRTAIDRASSWERAAEALRDAILADPDDLEQRRVYADHLLQRGHPHGELILLQLTGEATADQRRREKDLLHRHWRSFLGELEPVVLKLGLRFEGGFPVKASVRFRSPADFEQLGQSAAWATYEDVELRPNKNFTGFRPPDFFKEANLPRLRIARGIHGMDELETLAFTGRDDHQIEGITCADLGHQFFWADRVDLPEGPFRLHALKRVVAPVQLHPVIRQLPWPDHVELEIG